MNLRTYAEINLKAIEHNFNEVKNKISGKAKILAVVKADAYGHGAVKISQLLDGKCDFFGVATIEEAVELKEYGIKKPVLILGRVFPWDYKTVCKYEIRIPVFTLDDARALSAESVRQGKNTPFHFAVDTGMSRIGFQVTAEDADICKEIVSLPGIYAEGLFSHFATADCKDLTRALAQREKYKTFVKMLEERGINIPVKHLNNSAGIMDFDEYFDMCRMGIITYGLYPSDEVDKTVLNLEPALTWKARISHIKTLEAGREISYGGTYTVAQDRVIATIPVGYADGYPRCLSNTGFVLIGGKRAPITGRVCMDQFMVDVTGIDCKPGDEAVLVGKQGSEELSMEEVSEAAYSFNYELPCRISKRVPRVYTE